MTAPRDAVEFLPSTVYEPSALPTPPTPSPAHPSPKTDHHRLAPESVNQPTPKGGQSRAELCTRAPSTLKADAAMAESTPRPAPAAFKGDSAMAKENTALPATGQEAHSKTDVHRTWTAAPHITRSLTAGSPAKATDELVRDDARAADKTEETLDSPPEVSLTVTRRLAKASASDHEKPLGPIKTPSPEAKPQRLRRTACTSAVPLISPRRRAPATASIDKDESATEEVVSPRASPAASAAVQSLKGGETADDEGEPRTLAATARPANEQIKSYGTSASAPALGKTVKSSSPPVPTVRRSPQTTPPLSPRQRAINAGAAAPLVRSALRSSSTSVEVGGEASASVAADAAAEEKDKKEEVNGISAEPDEPKEPSPAPLATQRGTSVASKVEEIRARLTASRQQSMSTQLTPRSSVGSVTTAGAANALKDDAAALEAATTIKELKQALKDKDKAMALLGKDKSKAEQLLAKATKKFDDLQSKWETVETAFAAFKKETTAQKLEAQKELRQAQNAARVAQATQERLLKALEKQKEKLAAASSCATSAATTPVATPRGLPPSGSTSLVADAGDTALRQKLLRLEEENEAIKESAAAMKRELTAATAATVDAAVKEAEQQHAAMQEASREAVGKLKDEVTRLTEALAECDADLKSKDAVVQLLKAEVEQARKEREEMLRRWQRQQQENEEQQRNRKRADASTLTVDSSVSSTPPPEPREEDPKPSPSPSSPRTPRQVVTFALSAKEATAHLQEELTATQRQVNAYKRMQEHADRRIAQLEAALKSMQNRARDAVEALERRMKEENERRGAATSDSIALDAVRKELETARNERNALKQEAQTSGEESVRLRSALEEAEDERDVYERQLRDLQQEHKEFKLEAKQSMQQLESKMSGELKEAQGRLDDTGNELHATQEALRQRTAMVEELQTQIEALRRRCSEREALPASEENEAPGTAAADALTKQMEHYKRKSRTLTKKLADVEKELRVLGDEYTRVRGERDAAVMRQRTEEVSRHVVTIERERQPSEPANADHSLHSDGVPADCVSRDLSDALLSANRAASLRLRAEALTAAAAAVPSPSTAALGEEQRARTHLEKEVCALQAKVAAMEHFASPIMNPLSTEWAESLPSMENSGLMLPRLQQHPKGISDAPARARSPQTTHALDLRYFDPTSAEVSMPAAVKSGDGETGRSRAASQSIVASQEPLHRSQVFAALSPQRAGRSASTGRRGSALDAIYAEVPLPPVYACAHADVTDAATASTFITAYRPDLLFSTTAGALLVSKRGRQLHRPLVATRSLPRSSGERGDANSDDGTSDACYAALASMSHAIYASRMSAEGLFHLRHTYRYVLRVLTDCDAGEIMVGFADRYVSLESFGAKCNARRYTGCYYLNLQGGRLFAPSQGMCGEAYAGWNRSADTVAERRWQRCEGRVKAIESGFAGPSMSSQLSPSRHAIAPPECVARAGDEVACVLRLDERSISYEWNGVDCGVAFRGVSLSPSLYPCVEVNFSGGTVELL